MESQPGGIRINKFLTQLDFFSAGLYIYITDNKQSNSLLLTKMMVMKVHAPRGWGSAPLLFKQFSINFLRFNMVPMQDDFCRNLSARLCDFFFFYICFCSLLINTRLVFISYFVSVPLRKGHRGLEYQCSFVRLYLLLFAFLIICIETFCIFDYSQIFATLPPSLRRLIPSLIFRTLGLVRSNKEKLLTKGIVYNFR